MKTFENVRQYNSNDGGLQKQHFERYTDDIVVHCKTEKQAKYMLGQIQKRMQACKLQLQPEKTKIVNVRGFPKRNTRRDMTF